MKKYQWNIYELRKNINILTNLYELELDENKKSIILLHINIYKDMINSIFKRNINITNFLEEPNEYDNIEDLINELIDSYLDSDHNIINSILQSYDPLRSLHNPQVEETIPISATNDMLISINLDFIETMVPTSIKKDFITTINKAPIQITYNKNNSSYSGVTIYDEILRNKYIYLERHNDLMDITVLPHESFHYYFNDFNIAEASISNIIHTSEIEGNFANILFGDYFYKKAEEDKNIINMNFLNIYDDCVTELIFNTSLLDSLNKDKKIRMNKLNKQLNYFQIDTINEEADIIDYLTTPLDVNIKYALSYLVAIDLYYIYLKDPEFAFYLLKNIRFIKQENDLFSLFRRNHITFMDDNYLNFKKYVKKIERQN